LAATAPDGPSAGRAKDGIVPGETAWEDRKLLVEKALIFMVSAFYFCRQSATNGFQAPKGSA